MVQPPSADARAVAHAALLSAEQVLAHTSDTPTPALATSTTWLHWSTLLAEVQCSAVQATNQPSFTPAWPARTPELFAATTSALHPRPSPPRARRLPPNPQREPHHPTPAPSQKCPPRKPAPSTAASCANSLANRKIPAPPTKSCPPHPLCSSICAPASRSPLRQTLPVSRRRQTCLSSMRRRSACTPR